VEELELVLEWELELEEAVCVGRVDSKISKCARK